MYTIEKGVLDNSCAYFHTPSNIAKSMFFYLICAGHFYCDENYCVKRNNHDSYLLMYINKGEGTVWYNGRTYIARANDAIIINCHRPHMYKTANSWEALWLHFDGNVSDEYFQLIYNRLGCVVSMKDSNIVYKYINSILNTFKNKKMLNEPLISCYIQRMLAELLIVSSDHNNTDSTKPGPILDSINYIQNNYKNKISLNELSSKVCMSPYYFSRMFKRETGYSPYEYITMIRLNHAKNLLKTTNLLVKEIAFMVGFNSESNFVTCFKEHTDLTPSEFRSIPF